MDQNYNKKIDEIAKRASDAGVKEENIYKFACYVLDNDSEAKTKNKEELEKLIKAFNEIINDNDGVYMIKSKEGRLDCCQALKKAEREKKLKQFKEFITKDDVQIRTANIITKMVSYLEIMLNRVLDMIFLSILVALLLSGSFLFSSLATEMYKSAFPSQSRFTGNQSSLTTLV